MAAEVLCKARKARAFLLQKCTCLTKFRETNAVHRGADFVEDILSVLEDIEQLARLVRSSSNRIWFGFVCFEKDNLKFQI